MNLEEASSAWLRESADGDDLSPRLGTEDLHELAAHCLDRGVGAVCVTLDEQGCVVFAKDAAGDMVESVVGRIHVENVVDTTGCGDSFAAGLAFGYLEFQNYVLGCRYGNAMGAQRCSGAQLNVYLSRADTEKQLLAAYGPH